MKKSDLGSRRRVIDVLREGKAIKTKELSKESDVPLRTLWRILDELKVLGLVEKRAGKYWVWSEYEKRWKGSPEEYRAGINHAQDLIPGFKQLINNFPDSWFPFYFSSIQSNSINNNEECSSVFSFKRLPPTEQISYLTKCAESHLKSYPEIYENYSNCKNLKEKCKKTDINTQRVLNEVGSVVSFIDDITPAMEKAFTISKKEMIENEIPYIIGNWASLSDFFRPEKPRLKLKNSSIIAGNRGYVRFRGYKNPVIAVKGPLEGDFETDKFEEIIKEIPTVTKSAEALATQIYKLILEIQHQPLTGHCKQCPNISVKNDQYIKFH